MAELAAVALLGVYIAAGVVFGTRYIDPDSLHRYQEAKYSADAPIVRPLNPSGKDWPAPPQS